MVECGRGCQLPLVDQQEGCIESLVTQNVMHASLCHMSSGTFQGRHNAMFMASRRVLLAPRRVPYPSKTA